MKFIIFLAFMLSHELESGDLIHILVKLFNSNHSWFSRASLEAESQNNEKRSG